jgi:hypothetical protein
MNNWCKATVLVLVAAATLEGASAQEPPNIRNRKIEAVRVTAPPKIDGVLDDECWTTLPKAAPFYDNATGALVKDQTVAWIGYDDKFFYIAFECHESRPDKIVARETKRGGDIYSDDYVAVYFNPYGTKSGDDESGFMVNPLGTQYGRIAEGRANKQEWEGEWQSAAKIGANRWTVEMAVPWKILKHRKTGGKPVKMDVNFTRRQQWSGVFSCWSYTTVQQKAEFTGEWLGVAIPDGADDPPLSTMWYAYSGLERDRLQGKAGIDLRYRIDAERTALLTVNPDFGNIEQSVTSIDFSYASKLGTETRPFFLEGANFVAGQGRNAFTSVRIPDIDFGAKFFGRVSPDVSAGVLATHSIDAERTDAVVNISKRFSQFDSLFVGAVTRREPGINNTVLGATGTMSRGNFSLFGRYLSSDDRTGSGDAGSFTGYWQSGPWAAYAEHDFVSPGFLPRDGYIAYNDQRVYSVGGYFNGPWRSGPFRDAYCSLDFTRAFHYDDSFFREEASLYLSGTTRSRWTAYSSWSIGKFEDYRDHVVRMGIGYPEYNTNRYVSVGGAFGRQSSMDYGSIEGLITWRFDKRLVLGMTAEYVDIGGTRTQYTSTLSYDLAKDQAVGGRLVMRDGVANWYLSYRKSGYKGTEYYVILGDPNAEKFQTRLVFKFVGVL